MKSIFKSAIMIAAIVSAAMPAQPLMAVAQQNASDLVDHCRNRGVHFELDESSCISIGDQHVLATCDMSLNNPTWTMTDIECDPQSQVNSRAD